MGNSQNDFQDFYHDDPIEEISHSKLRSTFLTTGVLILGSIFFFQSTLASNISLSSGRGIEFGQSISQTVACSGQNSLTLTPGSTFINGSDAAGSHYLKTITVSNIPTSCRGADFTVRAYGDSASSPLSLFNVNMGTVTIETIDTPGTSNDSGIAWAGAAGMSVSASATGDAFTVTFTTPAALSSDVAKITLESSKPYYFGGPGPGGGTVFYVSTTGFNCGPTFTARCKYLEAARNLWFGGGAEPLRKWANSTYQSTTVDNASSPETATATAIGWGYRNTRAIILQGNSDASTSAAALADSYTVTVRGVAVDDWYLPSQDELNQVCKWQRGRPWTSDADFCGGGVNNTGPGASGFTDDYYWSSSEYSSSIAWLHNFATTSQVPGAKGGNFLIRPIRAF